MPYEKVGKNEPMCIADEVPFDIPESWEWVRISGVFSVINGDRGKNYPAKSTLSNTGIPFISAVNLDGKTVIEDDNLLCLSDEQFNKLGSGKLEKDDVVVCIRGSLGKHGRYPFEKGAIASSLVILRPYLNIPLLSDFIMMYLDSPLFFSEIKRYDNGTAQPNLAAKSLEMFFLPLPPLPEQKRIVEKLNEVSSLTDNYAEAYVRVAELNQKFPELLKKSILQEAVQGKLVSQDPSDEPASVILDRIRAEKQKLVAEGKIKKDKHESVIFRRDNSHYEKCGFKEENIDDFISFELPDSWEWIRLSTILTSTDAGKSPQCENRPRTIGEWGVIKTTAIQDGYFLAEENKVLPPDFNLQESMVIHHGDLLITRAGPRNRTGVICVVDGEPENLILSDKTVRLLYLRNFVNPHYVMTALSSPAMQYFVVDAMTGMAASQVNISQEKMKTFLLPLPPLNEQQRIVDEVSKIFGRIDKLNF